MTPAKTAAILRQFNEWRRDFDDKIEQPDSREIGEAIDAAVEMIERLEAAESEAIEQARLNGMGSEREAALLSKLEAAEKTNRGWLRANATGGWIDNLRIENDTLRAKIDQLEEDTKAVILAANSGAHRKLDEASLWQTIANGMITPAHIAQPAPSVPDTYAAGINAVAAMLQSKAAEYAKEHGHDDMGGLSFGSGMGGEIKMDYYTNLIELADDVRAMIAAAPEAKV